MMNKFNLEITYKDICSVTHNQDSFSTELIVELFDGSIIKALKYKDPSDFRRSIRLYNDEKYDTLNKVVNDYLRYVEALKCGQDWAGKKLKEVEEELAAEYEEYDEEYEIEEELEGE